MFHESQSGRLKDRQQRLFELNHTMLSLKTASVILIVVLSIGDLTPPPCFGGSDAEESAKTGDAAAIREDSRPVLVIPAGDCRTASFVLARVSRHLRDAERSALFSAAAEDEYDDGLQALIDGNCAQGIEYLRASDSALQQSPDFEFFRSPAETR
jgi:hypothetical protein